VLCARDANAYLISSSAALAIRTEANHAVDIHSLVFAPHAWSCLSLACGVPIRGVGRTSPVGQASWPYLVRRVVPGSFVGNMGVTRAGIESIAVAVMRLVIC
jgi:hypothetical protein